MIREFSVYFLVSLMALAVDMGILLILARFIHYTIAASVSFILGSIVHYRFSVSFVFGRRKLEHRKMTEFSVFVAAGLFGLVVNLLVIFVCVEHLGSSLPLAKLAAAGCSFGVGYLVRKLALF